MQVERDHDVLVRTLAFEREVVASVSTRLVPFTWGTAYLNDGYRERWDSNFLWVDQTVDEHDPDAGSACRRGGARARGRGSDAPRDPDRRRRIRQVGLCGSRSSRLRGRPVGGHGAPTAAGSTRHVRRCRGGRPGDAPPRAGDRAATRAVGHDRGGGAVARRFPRRAANGTSARASSARASTARSPRCASSTSAGRSRKIEDVNTLEEFRNRGLARAVVQRAADEARRPARADLVFLHALDDDWPKELYAKLGFDPIGHVWSFVRPSSSAVKSPA